MTKTDTRTGDSSFCPSFPKCLAELLNLKLNSPFHALIRFEVKPDNLFRYLFIFTVRLKI